MVGERRSLMLRGITKIDKNKQIAIPSCLIGGVFQDISLYYCCLSLSKYIIFKLLSQFSRSVVTDSLQPHESQHARPPCPSPTPRVYSNLCPSSRWCLPAISSSVVPFSSCPQSLPASGPFQTARLFQIKKFPNTFTFSKILNIQEFALTYFICWERK